MTMQKILVTGANGQVGRAFLKLLGDKAVGVTRAELDLSDPESLSAKLAEYNPSAVINAAAYTAVDKAEEEEQSAFLINAQAVGYIADYCFDNDIPMVHFSTDYVFAGDGEAARLEDDEYNPPNAYGRTKLAGERHLIASQKRAGKGNWLNFRTSWVYDADGKNFVNTMLHLGKTREVLSVINDQIGAPTFADDIAKYSLEALEKSQKAATFPSGTYHLCGSGETSWHGFAEEIFRQVHGAGVELEIKEVMEIPTVDYPTPAKRPLNSRLDMTKLKDVFDITMPDWKDALIRCLKQKSL
jgi:dTDP-4-dehydrorhamnose reductase